MLDEKIMKYILEVEGGFVNHPADKGGPTKYGITQKTLQDAFKRKIVNHTNVKELSEDEANLIYYKMYYIPSEAEWIEKHFGKKLALIHLDAAINHGVRNAEKFFQKVVNHIAEKNILKVDGFIGPVTKRVSLEVLDSVSKINYACYVYLWKRLEFYRDIVMRNYKQRVFFVGWVNRLIKLEDYIRRM